MIVTTMKLIEKLESLDCRKDDKARRVLNTAPDTVANITADALENGLTIEELESLNVPVYRYSTQLTIHGKIADFNPAARPGGYKAVFQNGNGSIGVKYIAIDAAKKELIARAARVSASGWFASKDSQGFDLNKTFYVRDESTREQVKQTAIAALRSIPVSRFFGGAYAGVLPYGAGYYVSAYIGAIAAADLWPFIGEMLGVTETELAEKEAEAARIEAEKRAVYLKECDERAAQREERKRALLASLPAPLTVEPKEPGQTFRILSEITDNLLTIVLSKERGKVYYTVTARNGEAIENPKRGAYKTGWPKALAAGRLFPVDSPSVTSAPVSEPVTVPANASKDRTGPASPRQTFALFLATGKDWRGKVTTYGQASDALAAVQHLRGNKPAALAIVAGMLGQTP